jgi:4-amino-4-deoxy-L-arabinose transferase-like glycosyltransferase
MPWSWAFVLGVFRVVKHWRDESASSRAAWVFLLASFFVTFILFSATSFQLDYYTVIVYPFAAIIVAQSLIQSAARVNDRWMKWGNLLFVAAIGALALGFLIEVNQAALWWVAAVGVLLSALVLVWTRQQRPWISLVILPALMANMIYGVMEGISYTAFLNYSIPYNLTKQLKDQPLAPIYFRHVDMIVPLETALYRPVATADLQDQSTLPKQAHYWLVARENDVPDLAGVQVVSETKSCWLDHKTGLLPRTLRMAKGIEPCDVYRVLEIKSPSLDK